MAHGLRTIANKSPSNALAGHGQLIDTIHNRLSELGSEIGRAHDGMQRLDNGLEQLGAGFTGMQKGFVETGTHLASRPLTLPKLSKEERRELAALERPTTLLTARGPSRAVPVPTTGTSHHYSNSNNTNYKDRDVKERDGRDKDAKDSPPKIAEETKKPFFSRGLSFANTKTPETECWARSPADDMLLTSTFRHSGCAQSPVSDR